MTLYTLCFGAFFGDMTTKENRLSEAEVYRTIRIVGEAIFSLLFTYLFDINAVGTLLTILFFTLTGMLISQGLYKNFQKTPSTME